MFNLGRYYEYEHYGLPIYSGLLSNQVACHANSMYADDKEFYSIITAKNGQRFLAGGAILPA